MFRMTFLFLFVAVFFSAPTFSATRQENAPSYISNLTGSRGIVLCFHGHGGNGAYWGTGERKAYLGVMLANGFSYICPSSVDRRDAKWSSVNNASNPDVKNVDSILNALRISSAMPIFLVGHSNGGGFIGRYAMFSSRVNQIKALQYQNASGLPPILSHEGYKTPSLFVGAKCDRVVEYDKITKSMSILDAKVPDVRHELFLLDDFYPVGSNCHPFLSQSAAPAASFFNQVLQVGGVTSGGVSPSGKKERIQGYIERRFRD